MKSAATSGAVSVGSIGSGGRSSARRGMGGSIEGGRSSAVSFSSRSFGAPRGEARRSGMINLSNALNPTSSVARSTALEFRAIGRQPLINIHQPKMDSPKPFTRRIEAKPGFIGQPNKEPYKLMTKTDITRVENNYHNLPAHKRASRVVAELRSIARSSTTPRIEVPNLTRRIVESSQTREAFVATKKARLAKIETAFRKLTSRETKTQSIVLPQAKTETRTQIMPLPKAREMVMQQVEPQVQTQAQVRAEVRALPKSQIQPSEKVREEQKQKEQEPKKIRVSKAYFEVDRPTNKKRALEAVFAYAKTRMRAYFEGKKSVSSQEIADNMHNVKWFKAESKSIEGIEPDGSVGKYLGTIAQQGEIKSIRELLSAVDRAERAYPATNLTTEPKDEVVDSSQVNIVHNRKNPFMAWLDKKMVRVWMEVRNGKNPELVTAAA